MAFIRTMAFLPLLLTPGCLTTFDMAVEKEPPVKMQVLRTKGPASVKISSVLALVPTATQRLNLLPEDIREKSFFINMIEDFLLGNGYTVITNDFLINVRNRLSPRLDPDKLRNSEYAMLTDARYVDALIKINSLAISMDDLSLILEKSRSQLVRGKENFAKIMEKYKMQGYEAGDEYCIYQIPYYQFEWSVELIHIRTGRILAKGYQKANSLNQIPEDYKARFALGDIPSCLKVSENFNVKKYTDTERLKKNLVKYMNEALVQLFKDYPPSKNSTLTAVESFEDIDRVQISVPPKKRSETRKLKKKSIPQPVPAEAEIPEGEEEEPSLPEHEVRSQRDETSPEPEAIDTGEEKVKKEIREKPRTDEEKLIEALRKW